MMSRKSMLRKSLRAVLLLASLSWLAIDAHAQPLDVAHIDVARLDRQRILLAAQAGLLEAPLTITSFPSPRSSGGPHDFYSEGDYWWPDPAHPGGPYVQRDGLTNPDNFVDHRRVLLRFSVQLPALVEDFRRQAVRRPRRGAPAGMVHRPAHPPESQPAIRPGHLRQIHRPRHRHHRHRAPGRSGARDRSAGNRRRLVHHRAQTDRAMVHRLPRMDDP
jgi:hypothetical protein